MAELVTVRSFYELSTAERAALSEEEFLASVDVARRNDRIKRNVEFNPLAEILNDQAYSLFKWIDESLQKRDPSINAEEIGSHGVKRTFPAERATNEDCAVFTADVTLTAKFDHRKDIAEQLGTWLKKQSAILAEAAEEILAIEDYRHLPMIERLISEEGLAERMYIEEERLSSDGQRILTQAEAAAE